MTVLISVPIWCWWGLETAFWVPACLTTLSPDSYHRLPPPVSENVTRWRLDRHIQYKQKDSFQCFLSFSSPWAPPASCSNASSSVSAAHQWPKALLLAPPALSEGNGNKWITVILKSNKKNTLLSYTTKILASDWLKWFSPFEFWPWALSFHFCQYSPAVFFPAASLWQPTIAGTRPLWSPAEMPEVQRQMERADAEEWREKDF